MGILKGKRQCSQNIETEREFEQFGFFVKSVKLLLLQIINGNSMTHSIEEKKNSLIVFKYGRCTHSNNRDIHYFIIKKPIDSMENLQPKWS